MIIFSNWKFEKEKDSCHFELTIRPQYKQTTLLLINSISIKKADAPNPPHPN